MTTVLIVEDELLLAEDLKARLQKLGCEVLGPAPSCTAAIELLWQQQPDLAFVDTQLGSETCEAVLSECALMGVPVIISHAQELGERPEFTGSLSNIGKPFSDSEIAQAVADHRVA